MVNEPSSLKAKQDRELLSEELSRALELDQFFLVYQPTMDLQSNAFAGVEALLRWRTNERGVVKPDVFLPELEQSGQIVAVGRWALETACHQGAAWHAKGYRFAVSVNISVKQLELTTFVDDVRSALSSARYDPALLVLEFSQESLLRGGESTLNTIEQLKAFGVRIAVDDFTPGVSPLSTLKKIPIDIVKLDRNFINGITKSPQDVELVQSLVQLGKTLNLLIVASGIEDIDQRRHLQVKEINFGQGFLFSAPHEAEQIDQFLEDFAIFSGRPL
jgi:EAL domain-containing protein (putative c-di-GMP-specific phosphodiesterase class I)